MVDTKGIGDSSDIVQKWGERKRRTNSDNKICLLLLIFEYWVFLVAAIQETQVQSLSQEDPLEKGMVAHSSILAWGIPWTGEPGGL